MNTGFKVTFVGGRVLKLYGLLLCFPFGVLNKSGTLLTSATVDDY